VNLDALVATWPVTTASVSVLTPDGVLASSGPRERVFAWASVTKTVTALATWVAVEEGTVAFEDPAGPPGATLGHLLAHASGLAPARDLVLAAPGTRRIYSNRGIEVAAAHVSRRAGLPFGTYAREAVLEPLGMRSTTFDGSPASGSTGPLADLERLAAELLRPTIVSAATLARTTAVAFPSLPGVLPGFGRQAHNDWGLGVEVRDHKAPHWMPASASPRTFGHFGRAGGFLWIDPEADVALVCLTDEPFGAWAAAAWPVLGEAVLSRRRSAPG
jgi:CubicO group peptidase (beta-lactamase class C family)